MQNKVTSDGPINKTETESSFMGKIINVFKEPSAIQTISDPAVVKREYTKWRIKLFILLFLSYVVFYMCRKNFNFASKAMEKDLHIQREILGNILALSSLIYGLGKFVNGLIADKANVRVFLPFNLTLSAVANILVMLSTLIISTTTDTFLGLPSSSYLIFAITFFWGMNGFFQGGGFPPAAKTLTYWYSNQERATKWSFWSTSHEIGTYLSVVLSGYLMYNLNLDWRSTFYVPAIIAIIFSVFLLISLRDKPKTIGLPDIEEYHHSKPIEADISAEDDGKTRFQILKEYVFCNKSVWLLALAYIFVYIVRYGPIDWGLHYLSEAKGYSDKEANSMVAYLPLFGIIGTAAAGFVSDKIFRGKRALTNITCLAFVAVFIFCLNMVSNMPVVEKVLLSLIGMFTNIPQVLIGGLCAIESSSKRVASAVTGFTGFCGYLGTASAAALTPRIVHSYGWTVGVYFWIGSAVVCMILLTPLLFKKVKVKKCRT